MTAQTGRVSTVEIGRRLSKLEEDFKHGLDGLHRRLDELNYVHPETLELKLLIEAGHHRDFERRLSSLEQADKDRQKESRDNRRLAWTSLAAPIIVGLLVVIILRAMQL